MRPSPFRLLASLALPLALLLAGGTAASAPKGAIFDYAERGYVRLDPMWASERPNDERLILAVFECLTRLDAVTGKVAPAAAERWTSAADGRSWTFTLRADGAWSDGTPVKAQDFVRAWRRILDPDLDAPSPWRHLFRPILGAATIVDNDFGRRVLDRVHKQLTELVASKKDGVPGRELRDLIDAEGLKAVPGAAEQPVLRKLLRWGEDKFPPKQSAEVLEVLKTERRARKVPTFEAYDAFGVSKGVVAKDDRTLVVETDGWVPFLPELLARGAFAPLPPALAEMREIGENTDTFVGNGPFKLFGRGAKSRGSGGTPSVVHLVRSTTYKGPALAKLDEIRCWTDEPGGEETRRYKAQQLQWIASPDEELKKDWEALPGYRTRPSGAVALLRFRCDSEPFEKREARRAFALTIDRAALAKGLWPAGEVAERIVPPMVKGAGAGVKGLSPDAGAAKKALADAGTTPEKFPAVDLKYAEIGGLDSIASRLVKGWEKQLGISQPGHWIEAGFEAQRVVRAGTFQVFLSTLRGSIDDASGYLEVFASGSPDGGLGWKDEAFDLFLAGARDVDAAAAAPEKLLAVVKNPLTKERLAAAKASLSESTRSALRQALLAEAEQRLLDEAVVVPLVFLRTPEVLGPVKGLGEEAAWSNCAFVGSLRDATLAP